MFHYCWCSDVFLVKCTRLLFSYHLIYTGSPVPQPGRNPSTLHTRSTANHDMGPAGVIHHRDNNALQSGLVSEAAGLGFWLGDIVVFAG